jgi:hypothetical protein
MAEYVKRLVPLVIVGAMVFGSHGYSQERHTDQHKSYKIVFQDDGVYEIKNGKTTKIYPPIDSRRSPTRLPGFYKGSDGSLHELKSKNGVQQNKNRTQYDESRLRELERKWLEWKERQRGRGRIK